VSKRIHILGGGLAGCEAAWQVARAGLGATVYEMRPVRLTAAHKTGRLAELVCSNSLKSEQENSASWLLKQELRRLGSLLIRVADECRVPAGHALTVDRDVFSGLVTEAVEQEPRIEIRREEVTALPEEGIVVIATGPLTSDALANEIARLTGSERLFFFDSISPIVDAETIDYSVAFRASRYGKSLEGSDDYVNCPFDKAQYERFLEALLHAESADAHIPDDAVYFEACLPIEELARRGKDTLRFGPMKPVGLVDPRTGRRPYAAVQLRQDTLAADHYNLVGFQTRLTWGAQAEVFRSIPGLEQAAFARFGSIHRNTYVLAPEVLDATLAARACPNLWIAGQLSGVEGYLESAAAGLAAAHSIDQALRNLEPSPFPRETVLGALLHYLAHAETKHFAPVNAMLGLLPPLPDGTVDARTAKRAGGARGLKQARGLAYRERALAALEAHLGSLS